MVSIAPVTLIGYDELKAIERDLDAALDTNDQERRRRLVSNALGYLRARTAFHNPDCEPHDCEYCGARYTGPGVYCRMACAEADA